VVKKYHRQRARKKEFQERIWRLQTVDNSVEATRKLKFRRVGGVKITKF